MKSDFTRKLLNLGITLHRRTLAKECSALCAKTDAAWANVMQQKEVIAAEKARLEDLRLAAALQEDLANAALSSMDAELAQYPTRP